MKTETETTDIALQGGNALAAAAGLDISFDIGDDIVGDIENEHAMGSETKVRLHGVTGEFITTGNEAMPEGPFVLNHMSFKAGITVWADDGVDGNPPIGEFTRGVFSNAKAITAQEAIEAVPELKVLSDVKITEQKASFKVSGTAPDGKEKKYDLNKSYTFVIKDKETGQELTYSAQNTTAMLSAKMLLKALVGPTAKYKTHFPVITVATESFKNSFGSKTHKPIMKVVDWVDAVKFDTVVGADNV